MGKWVITVTNLVEGLLQGAVYTRLRFFKDPARNPPKESIAIKLGDRRCGENLFYRLSKRVDVQPAPNGQEVDEPEESSLHIRPPRSLAHHTGLVQQNVVLGRGRETVDKLYGFDISLIPLLLHTRRLTCNDVQFCSAFVVSIVDSWSVAGTGDAWPRVQLRGGNHRALPCTAVLPHQRVDCHKVRHRLVFVTVVSVQC